MHAYQIIPTSDLPYVSLFSRTIVLSEIRKKKAEDLKVYQLRGS